MVSLESPRLALRPIEAGDVDAIAALHADPRVAGQLVDGVPDTPDKARIFLAWNRPLAARGMGTFAVRRRGSEALIGLYSLTPFEGGEAILEFGGKLARSAWGGGIALEAAAAVIDHAFDTLDHDRLISAFDPANRSARAALAKLGFEPAGSGTLYGRPVDRMVLNRDEWRGRGLSEAIMARAGKKSQSNVMIGGYKDGAA